VSAAWKAKVDPPCGSHQTFRLFVATEPEKWALGGSITARTGPGIDGDEAYALRNLLVAVMPVEDVGPAS
jgi:hypothetical protein